MKKNAVGPAGILAPNRQQRLIDGFNSRFGLCRSELEKVSLKQQAEQEEAAAQAEQSRAQVVTSCRKRRRDLLDDWDRQQEDCISDYEIQIADQQNQLSRLSVLFRRKLAEQLKRIEQQTTEKKAKAKKSCDRSLEELRVSHRQENRLIEKHRERFVSKYKEIDAIVVRRLDGLPDSSNADSSQAASPPVHFDRAFDFGHYTETQIQQIDSLLQSLTGTTVAKIVESWFLPLAGCLTGFLLAFLGYFYRPFTADIPQLLWFVIGPAISGLVGFGFYVCLMFPLKAQTRSHFSAIAPLLSGFEKEFLRYQKFLASGFADSEKRFLQQCDTEIDAASHWQNETKKDLEDRLASEQATQSDQIQSTIQSLNDRFSSFNQDLNHRMRQHADRLAEEISQELTRADHELSNKKRQLDEQQTKETQRIHDRLLRGIDDLQRRVIQSNDRVQDRLTDWKLLAESRSESTEILDFLPIGKLNVEPWVSSVKRSLIDASSKSLGQSDRSGENAFSSEFVEFTDLPVVLHRRLYSGLFITSDDSTMPQAVEFIHQILWRLLASVPASKANLVLIDPLGRGQNFTNFMSLADYDPQMVGHRVWTTEEHIETRLGEMVHHAEDLLQSCLRDRFERIEDYNREAGALAEPYSVVAAVGFPNGLNRNAYRHMNALIESGLRCGNTVLMVGDRKAVWPSDMPAPIQSKCLRIDVSEELGWRLQVDRLDQFELSPHVGPDNEERQQLIDRLGRNAVEAARVEVPLGQLIDEEAAPENTTDDGFAITVGTQGAGRPIFLSIGEGVKQHVLIAGKTGSGKSTLLHSLITAGAMKYQPDQLQYFLLDFKKGVEFKPYADSGLPHARVIGIESEREFGRSVLQRLDRELQERGEKFRVHSVQSIGQYKKKAGEQLPRIVLVVDEFQELFVRDDRIANECTMLLDRIVRQGRSFGLHVVLSSQSLAGAYSLPRATLGQMAIRIAMQCSESDAALILSDENTAAKMIRRPGEAIYNDAGGLVEGNQPFQVAWLSASEHQRMLQKITLRDAEFEIGLQPRVVFEGNRPSRWRRDLADVALLQDSNENVIGLIGESVDIGPPVSVQFRDEPGRNLLVVATEEVRTAIQALLLVSFLKTHPSTQIYVFEGHRKRPKKPLWESLDLSGFDLRVAAPRDCESKIIEIEKLVQARMDGDQDHSPLFMFIDPLERFRELRQEENFSFSLSGDTDAKSASAALQSILKDGPSVNVFAVVACASVETLTRWLPRSSHRDLELRLLGQMNPSDSAFLIDSSEASQLSGATILLYDDADGGVQKCRVFECPNPEDLARWLNVDLL